MDHLARIKFTRDKLNAISPSFCTQKWLHQTLYLHTGDNHSCYHPRPHHIGLDEIAENPAALHNTRWKKDQRKMMLEGVRPPECYYCWNIEDLSGEHISDRMIHSSSDYSVPEIENIAKLPWNANINPRYLEVSFGNACNFRCGYCCPQASTMWVEEIKKHGNHDLTYNQYGIEFLKGGTYYGPKDENPYIEAFWKWWPYLRKDLHTLRITGGEPLMNPAAFKFFDLLEKEPAPNLTVTVNSNLGVSYNKVDRLLDRLRSLVEQKKIGRVTFFSSIESWGPRAEYMRTGLKCGHWERNVKKIISEGYQLNLMCTYNVLCVSNFQLLLNKIIEWRRELGSRSVLFDTPYLKEPPHWMINILTDDFKQHQLSTLKFIEDRPEIFSNVEYEKMKRVTDYMLENPVKEETIRNGRRDFYSFFSENDRRLGLDITEVFPEYKDFYAFCKTVYDTYEK